MFYFEKLLFMYPSYCLTVVKWLSNNWPQELKKNDGKLNDLTLRLVRGEKKKAELKCVL